MGANRVAQGAAVSGLMLFGTTCSLFAKIVYEIKGTGLDGKEKYFHKPWAMTTLMFIGMSFCLPFAYYQEHQKRKAMKEFDQPLLTAGGPHAHKRSELREVLLLSIPTFFDLVATILMNVGLLYVTASVYQMMRGAEMLFAASFAVIFLKRKLNRFHLAGILCCVVGISLVGISSILSGEGSATQVVSQEQMLGGMALIIGSQAVQAAQLTFEDFFMADLNIPGPKIVGYEGVFGVIATLLIVAPIARLVPGVEGEGFHEDFLDTIAMVKSSRALTIILLVDMFALLLYNLSGMAVTGHLGAVFRTVLETMRTLFVWLVDLLLFYTPLGHGQVGESWSKWSYIQAVGFAVLVTGTLVYRRGDSEDAKKEMAEAVMFEEGGHTGEPAVQTSNGSYSPTMPISTRPVPSRPVEARGSEFRASQTIGVGSYSRSLPKNATHMASSPYIRVSSGTTPVPASGIQHRPITVGDQDSD